MDKIILIILISFFITSCSGKNTRVHGKYIVWIGGAAVSAGHYTDFYTQKDGMITFIDKRSGKTVSVPVCNVFKIEKN